MQRTGIVPIAMCLWPGLTRLWYLGQWSALVVAIGFAFLLNLGLICKFVWPELVHQHVLVMIWSGAILLWAFCGWKQYRERDDLLVADPHPETDNDPLLFEAQCEYLAGRQDDAVSLLERILFKDPRDVEARLLLATIRRRQYRFEEADEQLTAIGKFDGAVKWADEIENEVRQLESDESMFEENANNSELGNDSTRTAIPETPELETIEGTEEEPVAETSNRGESDVEQVGRQSDQVSDATMTHVESGEVADKAAFEIAAEADDERADKKVDEVIARKSDDSPNEMSIAERFERQLSEISVSDDSRRTANRRNRKSDAA